MYKIRRRKNERTTVQVAVAERVNWSIGQSSKILLWEKDVQVTLALLHLRHNIQVIKL